MLGFKLNHVSEGGHWWIPCDLALVGRVLGPVSLMFFHRNSNSMEISFHSHLDSNTVIATKCSTWHDSCAVVACTEFVCDLMTSNGITARWSFHRTWIADTKLLAKWAPGDKMKQRIQCNWKDYFTYTIYTHQLLLLLSRHIQARHPYHRFGSAWVPIVRAYSERERYIYMGTK